VFARIKDFFREVKIELKKVVFPSREEVIGSTKIVVILTIIIAVFLYSIDLILTTLVGMLIK
jgi:preprotein translocase subunit SecE